ncbi:hypothetical protein AKJ16_DCAP23531 [Drosera capensis]
MCSFSLPTFVRPNAHLSTWQSKKSWPGIRSNRRLSVVTCHMDFSLQVKFQHGIPAMQNVRGPNGHSNGGLKNRIDIAQ